MLTHLLHAILHIFHMVFHMRYCEIPSGNSVPVLQGFYLIISTWYFMFLWKNMWHHAKRKIHMVFTWTSHIFHRVPMQLIAVTTNYDLPAIYDLGA